MRATTTCMTAAALAVLACGVLADEPEVVARVKVHNSAAEAMTDVVVCGALPLPRDYDRPVDGLTLRDGEALLPTQVSVFATYPGSSAAHPVGRPEVVQLAARVTLPPAGFKALDVVAPPSAEPTKAAAPGRAIADWLAGEAPLLVEATDVFGNRYRAAPVARAALVETRQSGPVLAERGYECVLAPAGAPAAE